jgi:zinc/manganese transport system substrate-binding protein
MRVLLFVFMLLPSLAFAKIKIYTTTTNLMSLAQLIGGDKVEVNSLCKGTQDPHYLEAKPSFAMKLSKADLLISVGLGLEEGWLPLVVRGSRNPELREGQRGRFVAGDYAKVLEVHTKSISRSEGDVHPEGNPHFMLGPDQVGLIALALLKKLQAIDAGHFAYYQKRFNTFQKSLSEKILKWKGAISLPIKVITYHKTLKYFYAYFGIDNVDFLEPKPGIPPSASHVIGLIKKIKNQGIGYILVENYFDDTVARRIKKEVPSLKVQRVPVAVNGEAGIKDLFHLFDHLVGVLK